MKKKDLTVIIILIIIIAIAAFIVFSFTSNDSPYAIVYYHNEEIDRVDLTVDGYYQYQGDYGSFCLEVKEGRYHAVDVDCPNHDCEQVGWVNQGSVTPIICLPNQIYVMQDESSINDID